MLSVNNAKSTNTEDTPLILRRHHSIVSRTKLERQARILGRIFNPMNDAAISVFTLTLISLILHYSIRAKESKWLPPSIFSLIGVVSLSSVGVEIINSYKLSKHSRFILGENYYAHAKILTQELTALLGREVLRDQTFEQWVVNLKQTTHSELIKTHIKDFETANRYNNIRTFIDHISILMLGISSFSYFTPDRYLLTYSIPATITMGIICSLQIGIDYIDHNWFRYEGSWRNLSLSRKKGLIHFKNAIKGLYHLIFGTSVCMQLVDTIENFHFSLVTNYDSFACISIYNSINASFFYYNPYSLFLLIPIFTVSGTYVAIRTIPERLCCPTSDVFRFIKQVNQGIMHGTKTTGLLMVLSQMFFWNLCVSIWGDNTWKTRSFLFTTIIATAISIISGLVTAINTFFNYQDPDPTKMSTAEHDVGKLRNEIIDIKEGLLKDAGNKDAHNMPVAMHDKSEIDPIIESQALSSEQTHTGNERSLWNSLCCFWRGSNSHEDAKELHVSSDLGGSINFQRV